MASSKADIWMPLYIADYLADTMRLSTEQHGAYLLLLMDYWRSGPLPDDDTVLAQVTRMTPFAWSNARSIVQAFFVVRDGHWHHGRADKEMVKAKDKKVSAKAKAEAAAAARWAKNASSNAPSITQAMPEQCPSPSPSPTTKKDQKQKIRASRSPGFTAQDLVDQHGVDKQVAEDFMQTRKEKRLANTQTALDGLIREFTLANRPVADGIRLCTEKGWGGFNHKWATDGDSNGNRGAAGGTTGGGNQGPMSAPDRVRAAIAAREAGADQQGGRTLEHQ